MNANKALDQVCEWFRDAGAKVGNRDDVPTLLQLGSALFYTGILDDVNLAIEVSAILHLGAEHHVPNDDRIEALALEYQCSAPSGIRIETSESDGTDVWSMILLHEDAFDPDVLDHRLRAFVDYSLRAIDEIYARLHPREVIEPVEGVSALDKMRELVGVDELIMKAEELASLVAVAEMRRREGLKASTVSPHLVFTGNPGTGKTTIARLMGAFFKEIGLLETGHLVEAKRSDLIGEYVGQTTPKTEGMVQRALGGVLFIDEAYQLREKHYGRSTTYGDECIATLLLAMENLRGQFALVVAGYPDEMAEFIESNPGLRSRFDQQWHFRDYTNEELVTIVENLASKNEYLLDPECAPKILSVFESMPRDRHFGNARAARDVFQSMKRRHAVRVRAQSSPNRDDLMRIIPDDIDELPKPKSRASFGFGRYMASRPSSSEDSGPGPAT